MSSSLDKVTQTFLARKEAVATWRIQEAIRRKATMEAHDKRISDAVKEAFAEGNSKAAISRAMGTKNRNLVYQYLEDTQDITPVAISGDKADIEGHKFTRINGIWEPDNLNPDSIKLLEKLT